MLSQSVNELKANMKNIDNDALKKTDRRILIS
jgi:hypothetical protein